jgi:hypothetical protein
MGPHGRNPLLANSGDTNSVLESCFMGMSADDLVGNALKVGVDGAVLLYFGLVVGVLGTEVGPKRANHFVLALCAAEAMEILNAKFGVLTARAGGELKKGSSSSLSAGGFE